MVSRSITILGSLALAAVLFSIPLLLKYKVYKPTIKKVATGDVIQVTGRLSSIWCQAVELKSASQFQSFLYDSEPEVDFGNRESTRMIYHTALLNRAQEYWGFHLLSGSLVNVSACSRLSGGEIMVVKGHHALQRCLKEYSGYMRRKGEASIEDSESESESDAATSSISSSQGVVSNETTKGYMCKNALHYTRIPYSYTCRSKYRTYDRRFVLSHDIKKSGYYYYVFSSDTYLDLLPNDFSVEFTIDRTFYNYSTSSSNCSTSNHCQLPIPLASERKIVVQMEPVNGPLKAEELEVACRPREWLFCIFYAGFLVVIFLCAFQ